MGLADHQKTARCVLEIDGVWDVLHQGAQQRAIAAGGLLKLVPRDGAARRLNQRRRLQIFPEQAVLRAMRNGFDDDAVFLRPSGQNQQRHAGRGLIKLAERVQSRAARQFQIQDDQREIAVAERGDALRQGGGAFHLETFGLQETGAPGNGADQQNRRGCFHGLIKQ